MSAAFDEKKSSGKHLEDLPRKREEKVSIGTTTFVKAFFILTSSEWTLPFFEESTLREP